LHTQLEKVFSALVARAWQRFKLRGLAVLLVAAAAMLGFGPMRLLRGENFVFFLPTGPNVVAYEVIGETPYLPLMPVLNMIGKVTALQERRGSLRVWLGETALELQPDSPEIRVRDARIRMNLPVRLLRGQWMVPAEFVTSVLPSLTRDAISYQAGTTRAFVGDVRPITFKLRLDPIPTGTRLVVQFNESVTLRTASRDGKWYLFLGARPVNPLESVFRFTDPYLREVRFDDQDGVPKLILTPALPGLNFYPSLTESGRVLVADVIRPGAPAHEPSLPPPTPTPGILPPPEEPSAGQEEAEPPASQLPMPLVVLDAAHGGSELGAHSRDHILEKDLVTQLVARVRLALLATRQYRVQLTRVGDVTLSFDDRDRAANTARPWAFLTFHAGNLGAGGPRVAVYLYQPPSPPTRPRRDLAEPFVRWELIQTRHIERSRALAQAVHRHLAELVGIAADQPSAEPVRGLRSINAPAVAIEIGSLAPDEDAAALTQPDFQNQLATAVVKALESFRNEAQKL
jgi:N-acetylmuramoyl-L-alanine amidase